jgi:long-chain acyl-CoA synthetase
MDFTRIFDIPLFQAQRYPQKIALAMLEQDAWRTYSSQDLLENIEQISVFLLQLGLKKGDKIALIGKAGSPYWNFIDFAAQQIGVIVVPILAAAIREQMEYILEECQIRYLFFNQKEDSEKCEYLFNDLKFDSYLLENQFDALKKNATTEEKNQIEQLRNSILPEDLATIIYTSGTGGEPKGVMLSHHNIVSNIKSILPLVPFLHAKTTMSFLPLSHVFERTITFSYMAMGANVYYTGGINQVEKCLTTLRPIYWSSVPRVLEKMYDRIIEERNNGNRLKKWIINYALKIAESYDSRKNYSILFQIQRFIADLLVYRQWRKALGGKVKGIVVGAAALQPKLSRIFSAAKIPIREGYGSTETSPVITFNRFQPGGVLFGSVGIPIPGVEVKIEKSEDYDGDDGEILVKGPNVMMGYFNKPDETKETFTEDGWYKTGDIGHFTNKWFLKITDRKKDFFKTSHGKFISPQVVENQLKTSAFVDQCMALGLGKPYVTALIVPNFHRLKEWCEANNVHWTAPQFMVINLKVEQFFQKIIDDCNEGLQGVEQVKKIHLLFEEWTVDSEELTPTLKVRRKKVIEKNTANINKLYEIKNGK